MEEKSIWDYFNFSEDPRPTVFSLLKPQAKLLEEKTNGVLTMTNDHDYNGMTAIYIVCPLLGNYRKRILRIIEKDLHQRFPVTIESDMTNELFHDIEEEDFLNKISEIVGHPVVSDRIISLYQQSMENGRQ